MRNLSIRMFLRFCDVAFNKCVSCQKKKTRRCQHFWRFLCNHLEFSAHTFSSNTTIFCTLVNCDVHTFNYFVFPGKAIELNREIQVNSNLVLVLKQIRIQASCGDTGQQNEQRFTYKESH